MKQVGFHFQKETTAPLTMPAHVRELSHGTVSAIKLSVCIRVLPVQTQWAEISRTRG